MYTRFSCKCFIGEGIHVTSNLRPAPPFLTCILQIDWNIWICRLVGFSIRSCISVMVSRALFAVASSLCKNIRPHLSSRPTNRSVPTAGMGTRSFVRSSGRLCRFRLPEFGNPLVDCLPDFSGLFFRDTAGIELPMRAFFTRDSRGGPRVAGPCACQIRTSISP